MPRGKPRLGAVVEQQAYDRRRQTSRLAKDAVREALAAVKADGSPDHRVRMQALKIYAKLYDRKGRKARIARASSAVSAGGKPNRLPGVKRADWAQRPAPAVESAQPREIPADPQSAQPGE